MQKPLKNQVRKPSKTMAGVTPLAVMLPPRGCNHGVCVYCPSLNVPQSYTPLSPAVIRAKMLDYDPYKQVQARLKAYKKMNHPTDKIELIIMGGTFLEYPKKFQFEFIKSCFDSLNNKISKSLDEAKKINETAKNRCVALCIETRPDRCSLDHIKDLLEFGTTRVELGVQMPDDKNYELTKRKHTVLDVINATFRLKEAGFKVGYHIMPGLPEMTPKKDLELFELIFSSSDFKPDQIKIYPCTVIKGSELENWYYEKKYVPYSIEVLKDILPKMIKMVPPYCRVMRMMREIPPVYMVSGTHRIDLRSEIENELKNSNEKINEIRMREIGFSKTSDFKTEIKDFIYESSKGEEHFLQVVNKENVLFGLLRLRFPFSKKDHFIKELSDCSIVRELHVYGKSLNLGEKGKTSQHKGLGKELMIQAEEISKKAGYKKIAVISGVGVREYYHKLGYNLVGNYMIKEL